MSPAAAPARAMPDDAIGPLLDTQRAAAERRLNGVRAGVLVALAMAAVAYAPSLTSTLIRINLVVLLPVLAWTVVQWAAWYRRGRHPAWLALANPVVDITAVTALLAGYGLDQNPALALKTPIFLLYFVILAARPVTSSTRRAAAVALLAVAEYGGLLALFALTDRLTFVTSPLVASATAGVAPLDEGARLLLLAMAGAVATYATHWHERLVRLHDAAARDRRELEVRLARAQLQSLKLQLHPHFLFNALNTITALVRTDPAAAERTIAELSEALRLALRSGSDQEVALSRELEILRHYLAIQQVRFQERLAVTYDIAPEASDALVPALLLQPLVENAIRHGLEPRASGGCLALAAARVNGHLQLTVRDDGVGLREAHSSGGHGIGLANTRERLARLYPGAHRFEMAAGADGGVVVRIELPFRLAEGRA